MGCPFSGCDDTNAYFNFSSTYEEIQRIVKNLNLVDGNVEVWRNKLYWWKPIVCAKTKVYHYQVGEITIYLNYDPDRNNTYFAYLKS